MQQITAAPPPDDDSDDPWTNADEAALVELPADDDYPPPPWTFCGYEPVILESPDCDVPRLTEEERWVDANGRSVDALARYRWLAYQANDHDDREGADAVRADMAHQVAAYKARNG